MENAKYRVTGNTRQTLMGSAILFLAVSSGCMRADGPAGITEITAADTTLNIRCSAPQPADLLELRSWQTYDAGEDFPVLGTGINTAQVTVPRFDGRRDRVFSKFLLINAQTKEPFGNTIYVTAFDVDNRPDTPILRPEGKKGLSCVADIGDAVELGVKYVHENIYLNDIITLDKDAKVLPYEYEGVQIPISRSYLRKLDARLRAFTDRGIGVFGVFLNRREGRAADNPLIHPDSAVEQSQTGILAFNVENETSARYYRAAIEFLADRYTRPDKQYGQLCALVIGNEVQQHWIWYNMGQQKEDVVLDDYHRAVRLAWLAVQKHHTDLRIYISMEHHWTQRGNPLREIRGDVFLEKMAGLSRSHGDFPWNLAFHPYPEDIFEPRVWRDRTVTDEFSTPKITIKNIEVLPRFMKQPQMLYDGRLRDIAVTEQGFHTPKGPDGELAQAAAYAYAYYKIAHIPEISVYIMHRHVDHLGEGGLLLGLWTAKRNGPTADTPSKKKYLWEVFKYADTPQWEKYFAFAKPILGIEHWGDTPTDKGPETKSAFNVLSEDILYNFVDRFETARSQNSLDCKTRDVLRAAGWMVPAIYQHPPYEGTAALTYTLDVPPLKDNRRIKLVFESYLAADGGNGVKAFIDVDGKQIFSTLQTAGVPEAHNLDLSDTAGRTVTLTFKVDNNGEIHKDWYYWINPLLIYE